MKYFLCVLGMVFIIEGFPYFIFPDKIKVYLMKVMGLPEAKLRIFGLLAMLTGLWLLFLGRT